MTVYVLMRNGHWYADGGDDWDEIVGIYDSLEKAENVQVELEKKYEEDPHWFMADEVEYYICEHIVE